MKWLKSVFGNEEKAEDAADDEKSSEKSVSFSVEENLSPGTSQTASNSLQPPNASDQVNSTWSSKDDKSARKSILRGGTSNLRPSSPKEAEPKKKLLTLAASDTGTSPSPKSDEKFFGLFGKTSNDNMSTTEVEVTPDGAMGSSPTQMKNENANEEEQKEFLSILDDLQNVFARSSSITPSEKEKTEPKDNNNTSEYGTKNPPDKLPRIVLEPASSEKATQKWDSLDEMERRLMENFSLEEDDTYRMEFDLQVLKSQIMRLRQQNRKHTHQIRKWNLNELRSELHKLSEQQELIEKAMLQDHVIQQNLNHIRSLKYLGRMEAIRNYGMNLDLSDLLDNTSQFDPFDLSSHFPRRNPGPGVYPENWCPEENIHSDVLPTYNPRYYGDDEVFSPRTNMSAENGLDGLETLYDHSINYNNWDADQQSPTRSCNQFWQNSFHPNEPEPPQPNYYRTSKHSISAHKKSRSSSAKLKYRKSTSSKYR